MSFSIWGGGSKICYFLRTYARGGGVKSVQVRTGGGEGGQNFKFYCVRTLWMAPFTLILDLMPLPLILHHWFFQGNEEKYKTLHVPPVMKI